MNRVKEGGGWEFLLKIREPAFTWNPASGCNNIDCAIRKRGVCWAQHTVKRLGRICPICPSFKPHMHDGFGGTPNRLWEPHNYYTPAAITSVSTGDLFGLPDWMISVIVGLMDDTLWHIYATLTKMPQRAHRFSPYPPNIWFGVGVNEQADVWRLDELQKIKAQLKWAIFEPLYSAIDYDLTFLDWIIVGPQSRPNLQPKREWVQSILNNAEDVPVFMKSTLDWHLPKRREPPRLHEEKQ